MQKFTLASVAVVLTVVLVAASGCSKTAASNDARLKPALDSAAQAEDSAAEGTPAGQTGAGMAALKQASEDDKYLFAFFSKEEDDQTTAMRTVFTSAMQELTDRANSVEIDVTAPSEQAIVEKFDLERSPMPIVLALAPNGAVTRAFPTEFDEQGLATAIVSPCTEKCMKSLQDNKLVFLCVQNAGTASNAAAMQGVEDFKADPGFQHATEIISLDPADAAEAEFLTQLDIAADTPQAVTVFLAPPAAAIGRFEGATSKQVLIETLNQAGTACGPDGCGPGGCCP